MQIFRRPISRLLLFAASLGVVTALAGCAGPGDRHASWPPRLNAASERMQAAETAADRRERAIEESGATVHLDRPYH